MAVPLTILQATADLFLVLTAVDLEEPRSLAAVLALAGRAAVLALVQASSTRRAELLRAELLGLQVLCSDASRVASQMEDIAALMLGGSWHVATDLRRHGSSWPRRGVVGRRD